MLIYCVIASLVWFLALLNYLFIIFNKCRHCLACSQPEAVPAFPFARVWFSFGPVPSGNEGSWWFLGTIYFTKWSAVCRSLRALLPMRTWALELRAFAQLLLPHNGINFLSIRQTQIVFVVSEEGQEEVTSARVNQLWVWMPNTIFLKKETKAMEVAVQSRIWNCLVKPAHILQDSHAYLVQHKSANINLLQLNPVAISVTTLNSQETDSNSEINVI